MTPATPNFVSVCQHLVRAARLWPDRLAVIGADGNQLTAAGLVSAIVRYRLALEAIGVRAGMAVGLQSEDRTAHALIILACQALGAVTMSFSASDLRPGNRLVEGCDMVVFGDPEAVFEAPRRHRLTPAWLRAVQDIPVGEQDWACLERDMTAGEIIRISKTSGTSGQAKAMQVSAGAQMERIERDVAQNVSSAELTFLSLYNFQVEGNFVRCCSVLMKGGVVRFSSIDRLLADAAPDRQNYASLLLGDAERLVASIPSSWVRPDIFAVSVGGGRLPPRLRQALLSRLATDVQHRFSSNETGLIAMIGPDGVGTIVPGVEIAIRDEMGRTVADGERGLISVRSRAIVTGYLDNPAANARHFGEGWFHSNDWGFKPDAGGLVVLGRADDMLNIGGLKIPANLLEAQLREVEGVTEAALVTVASPFGVDHLAAMLEVRPGMVPDAIVAAATALLQRHCTCRLALSERLPRTETGKIRKAEIRDWFRKDMGFTTT